MSKGVFSKLSGFLSVYSLPIILVAAFAFFSILLPTTFPTLFNIKSILNYQAVTILISLAVMVPIAAGHFDMSVGYGVCIFHVLAIGLQVNSGLPWPLVILLVLAAGAVLGLVNGVLITRVGINSFIATLGVGTILYGIAFWYTDGQQIIGKLPAGFVKINSNLAGIPTTAIITLIVAILLWIMLEYTPLGRYFYFLGANPKAADLSGISVKKYLTLAFIFAGVLTAMASIMLASLLRVGQISVGPDYLMPAFAGSLLGSTAIHPGRVNVWGTVSGMLMLAVIISGLQQLGASYFVEPLFNGGILIVAVSMAVYAKRRRATHVDAKE